MSRLLRDLLVDRQQLEAETSLRLLITLSSTKSEILKQNQGGLLKIQHKYNYY